MGTADKLAPGSATTTDPASGGSVRATDMLILGGGLSGMAMAIEARRRGFDTVAILEKGADFGGTWRENRYPGVACDIPSHLYALARYPKPDWRRRYAPGDEIQAYIRDVARAEGLYGLARFGRTVAGADWDAEAECWRVATAEGETWQTRVLVPALGPLHVPKRPEIPGLERFRGQAFHSAEWPEGIDLAGRRVAVIGSGASAVQIVPEIAGRAAQVTVYQRTAPWVVPHFDFPVPAWLRWLYRHLPGLGALDRAIAFEIWEAKHAVFRGNRLAARAIERIAAWNMRRAIRDPEMRRKLAPDYRIGCKRILLSNRWYPALARPDVELVTGPVAEIREGSAVAEDGAERQHDVLIFATGFRVIDTFAHLPFRGRGGKPLQEAWREGISAYLGAGVNGFPNLFFLLGPNTALGHNSIVLMAEAQAEHVLRVLVEARARGIAAVEPKAEVQAAYNAEVARRLAGMVWSTGGCASWYKDADGRVPTLWPGTVRQFRRLARRSGLEDYAPAAG